ncbi:hypothetical protein pipiens_017038 [Culex pipiens pipiens]|uniref:Uncharacterized protein n=1 Tax=Culex pipiens pipiens TaxID=38569 RepID=A0ABD1CJS6_CULPP
MWAEIFKGLSGCHLLRIPGLIVQLCRLHPSLEHLDVLDNQFWFNKTQLNEMSQLLSNLKFLSYCLGSKPEQLHNMFPKETTRCYFDDLTALKSLILFSCKMSQDLLATLLSRCPSLHKLHMTHVTDALNDDVRRVICWKLPRLNELRVTMYIEVEGVERASRTDIRVVFDSLEQLRSAVTE